MHYKQTKEWGKFLESLGWKSLYLPQAVRVKKILLWSAIKVQKIKKVDDKLLSKLNDLAKKERALFVKLEFDTTIEKSSGDDLLLKKHGYKKDSWPLSPTKTIVVNLKGSLDEIKKSFSKDTKQRLKKTTGLMWQIGPIENQEALRNFYSVFKITAKEKKFWAPPFEEMINKAKAFSGKGFIVNIYKEDMVVSSAFVLICGDIAYYVHAGSTKEGQEANAPYLCLFEVIKECLKRGVKQLDLEGIYDKRYPKVTKDWKGFTVFKRKWGGVEILFRTPTIKSRYLSSFWGGA